MAAVDGSDAVMPDLTGLSQEEKDKVMAVMMKAKVYRKLFFHFIVFDLLCGLLKAVLSPAKWEVLKELFPLKL